MRGWHRGAAFSFQGRTHTLYEIARLVGMPTETLRNRVLNIGMSVEDAVATDKLPRRGGKKAKAYWFRGKLLSVKEHALATGITEGTLLARRSGDRILEAEEAREANDAFRDPPSNACLVTFRGRTMSIAAWSREVGMDQKTLAARLGHYQWSVAKALTTPVDPTRANSRVCRRNRRIIKRLTTTFRRMRHQQVIHRISTAFRINGVMCIGRVNR